MYSPVFSVREAAPCLGQHHWWLVDPRACSCWLRWTGSPAETLCRISSSLLGWLASIALREKPKQNMTRVILYWRHVQQLYFLHYRLRIKVGLSVTDATQLNITVGIVIPHNVHKVANRLENEWINEWIGTVLYMWSADIIYFLMIWCWRQKFNLLLFL